MNKILKIRMVHNGYHYEGSQSKGKLKWFINSVSGTQSVGEEKSKELTEKFKQLAKDV